MKKNKPSKTKQSKNIADFLFEASKLQKLPRTGLFFLGHTRQSLADHTNGVCFIAFFLARILKADTKKVLEMALFHDFAEVRVSDFNTITKRYCERNEDKAMNDVTTDLPFGDEIKKIFKEYEDRNTLESKIAKDADLIDLIILLKEEIEKGNNKAKSWIPRQIEMLNFKESKELAMEIVKGDSDYWWRKDHKKIGDDKYEKYFK